MSPGGSPKIQAKNAYLQTNRDLVQAIQADMHGDSPVQAAGTALAHSRSTQPLEQQPDATAEELEAVSRADLQEVEYVCVPRNRDFFAEGQFIRVKAEHYENIHNKCFIILDHREKQATGILVEVYQTKGELDQLRFSETAQYTTIALKCCRDDANHNGGMSKSVKIVGDSPSLRESTSSTSTQSRADPERTTRHARNRERHFKTRSPELERELGLLEGLLPRAYLRTGIDKFVAPGSFVLLDYTSAIPYDCECADLGKLESKSLISIRTRYLRNRAERWLLEQDDLFPP